MQLALKSSPPSDDLRGSMPVIQTKNFGPISYAPEAALEFPRGLPGFENRHRFVALGFSDSAPLVFLQSLEDADLCLITLPVLAIDPAYRLEINPDDVEELGLPAGSEPRIGKEVLCVAVLSIRETGPTANLLAPVVVHLGSNRAVQCIMPEGRYSLQHELQPQETLVCS